ncbi:DoxX family membrane protein [Ornithinimicrobium sp. W1665]|uniref:DoxX family membrane protein n=1 Tax=Ornithinimicrobium sp. W1665 TaxID=3416666 RepID=UPI003D6A031E
MPSELREDPGPEDYHHDVHDDWEDLDGSPAPEVHSRSLDLGLLLLRLGALLLVTRGLDKAVDLQTWIGAVDDHVLGAQAPELVAWLVLLGQLVLPLLLVVGLFTRPAAFLLAALMAAPWVLTVYPRLDYTVLGEGGAVTGEPTLLYLALTLPLVFTGAGRWSLDAMRSTGRP